MRELPAGHDAVMLDFSGDPAPTEAVARATAALHAARTAGTLLIADVVPSAQTVLVQADRGNGIDTLGVHRALRTGDASVATAGGADDELRIPVVYDGPDLADVARLLDVDIPRVVELHTNTLWQVQFMGFAPGFGYLIPHDEPDHPLCTVGRRSESRTRVPRGAVAIAAGYSAVYPRVSPGGWQLLGATSMTMWDEAAVPPARLRPGSLVRFVADE